MNRRWLATLTLCALVINNAPAQAHKMRLFASAIGATVTGTAYFSADAPAKGVTITAALGDGTVVFSGVTDDTGAFAFDVDRPGDLTLRAEGADGHQARFTLTQAERPPIAPASSASPSATRLTDVETAVARQMVPLRQRIDDLEAAMGWRDIVGALGYIIGLGGLAYGLMARRRLSGDRGQP